MREGKKNGIEIHAWKVMFQFAEGWLAPQGVGNAFRDSGRTQIDAAGNVTDWLSPCDPANIEYEISAMEELASNYDVDGGQTWAHVLGGKADATIPGCPWKTPCPAAGSTSIPTGFTKAASAPWRCYLARNAPPYLSPSGRAKGG